jgi:hypothetical protein
MKPYGLTREESTDGVWGTARKTSLIHANRWGNGARASGSLRNGGRAKTRRSFKRRERAEGKRECRGAE